jgi:putative hydrolase
MADVTLGYVYEFGAGEEFVASAGGGATLSGESISVPSGDGLEVISVESNKPERLLAAAQALVGRAYRVRTPGSIAISLAYVAAGRYDGMVSAKCRSVDAAGAQLIAREAGALVSFGDGSLEDATLDLTARYDLAAAAGPSPTSLRSTRSEGDAVSDGQTTVVDWTLAERVAVALAGSGAGWAAARRSSGRVRSRRATRSPLHRPEAKGADPVGELVDRAEWARVNIESFRHLATRVEASAGAGRWGQGRRGTAAHDRRSRNRRRDRARAGYLSQRVIGQYDVALIGPARAPRLLFVGPTSPPPAGASSRPGLFLRWIALHETTHAVHFASIPWLREHIGAIAEELFEKAAVEVKPGELIGKLVRMNPKELVRSATNGELATLLWPEPQRRLVERLTATMTMVEGYAEHVMDAVGDQLDPGYGDLRRALDRDRERGTPRFDRLQAPRARDEAGAVPPRKAFADEVVRIHGIRP